MAVAVVAAVVAATVVAARGGAVAVVAVAANDLLDEPGGARWSQVRGKEVEQGSTDPNKTGLTTKPLPPPVPCHPTPTGAMSCLLDEPASLVGSRGRLRVRVRVRVGRLSLSPTPKP